MATMHRTRNIGVSAGSAFGPRTPARGPASLVRLAVGALLCGLLLGSVVGAGVAIDSPEATVGLGGVLLAWLMLSFGSERPGEA